MLTELEARRSTALAPVGPSERVEALVGLLIVPLLILYGILVGLWRLVWRARRLEDRPAVFVAGQTRLRDVAAYAEAVEAESCELRRGFGALDFEMSYARDFLPSSLDAYPRLANRFFRCPPPFRRVTFESLDGTPLGAEIAIHEDGADRPGLVVVHGTFGSSGQEIYSRPAVRAFAQWGFNVVVVDLRGWGRSSALSTTSTSLGPRCESSFSPSSSCRAVISAGPSGMFGGSGSVIPIS